MLRVADRPPLAGLWPYAFLLLLIPFGAPLLEALRWLDSGICAQLPTHTLRPGGVALPLCARNTGIYTGAALSFGILRARGRQRAMLPPPPPVVAFLLTCIAAMAVDGMNSVAADLALPHLYPPTNALRLATGFGAGMALALLLAPVIARARFGAEDPRPPLVHLRDVLPCVGAALPAYLVVRSVAPWTLYPVAFLSNAGLLAVLAGLNSIALSAVAGLARSPNRFALRAGASPATLMLLCLTELALLAGMKTLLVGPGMVA
jgi:uncharacterized membrane protein